MKRLALVLLCLILAVSTLTACSGGSEGYLQINSPSASANGIDVDLSPLSSAMVYAEVYNMVTKPDAYFGKIVKLPGKFSYYLDESTGKYYFAVLTTDATACCQQGIEFDLANADSYKYPDDFPEVGEDVTVQGEFGSYQEAGTTYYTLLNAKMV